MATITTAARNAACDAIVDLMDAGAGTATLVIGTTGMGTTLATINLPNPAFGAAGASVAGRADLNGVPLSDTSADNTGTAAAFEMRDRDGTAVITGSVGTSGTDIIISSTSIVSGDTVQLDSFQITVPAS